jgi:hypothetical protein
MICTKIEKTFRTVSCQFCSKAAAVFDLFGKKLGHLATVSMMKMWQ